MRTRLLTFAFALATMLGLAAESNAAVFVRVGGPRVVVAPRFFAPSVVFPGAVVGRPAFVGSAFVGSPAFVVGNAFFTPAFVGSAFVGRPAFVVGNAFFTPRVFVGNGFFTPAVSPFFDVPVVDPISGQVIGVR